MLTRREHLLVRPWQQQRFKNHRRKVQSALPAIDVGPPPPRGHVCCKLKKLQWEEERCAQIEEDNFRLLQRMGSIMQTNRLDNHWLSQPPNFLHRVGIYKTRPTQSAATDSALTNTPEALSHRKIRCQACNPQKINMAQVIPEERVPWEPPKINVSRLLSSATSNTQSTFTTTSQRSHSRDVDASPHRVTVTRGSLRLQVDFPAQAGVKIKSGQQERMLQREYCQCKATPGKHM
ncbi:uncharacterized protein LOC134537659 [Bacillus rossius redtenbacheri]|uniref:uncharacterized protein LOC134537659 n=1 Tax=Bacillus rossius redtenbacheri TaxID=93214 RepID=UPI002FDEDC04